MSVTLISVKTRHFSAFECDELITDAFGDDFNRENGAYERLLETAAVLLHIQRLHPDTQIDFESTRTKYVQGGAALRVDLTIDCALNKDGKEPRTWVANFMK